MLLDLDRGALLRKQRPVSLSAKWLLERERAIPWKSQGRARIMVQMDGVGGTFHRVHWSALPGSHKPGRRCCAGCLASAASGPLQGGIATSISSLALVIDKRDEPPRWRGWMERMGAHGPRIKAASEQKPLGKIHSATA